MADFRNILQGLLRLSNRPRHVSGRPIEDKASGVKIDRLGMADAIRCLRDGGTLTVRKLDRLGRSMKHRIKIVAEPEAKGVGLRSITENIDTTTSSGRLVITPEKLAKALQYLASGPNLREAAARVKIGKTVLYQRSKSKISLVEGHLGLGHSRFTRWQAIRCHLDGRWSMAYIWPKGDHHNGRTTTLCTKL